MKKKFMWVLSIFIVAVFASSLVLAATPAHRQSPGTGEIMGQGKAASDAHKTFRLVRYVPPSGNNDSITLTADSIVVWDVLSDDGVTVTTTTKSGDNAVAGIMVIATLTPQLGTLGNSASADLKNVNWGWLQTYGPATALLAPGAVGSLGSAGLAFGTAVNRGRVSAFIQSTTLGASLKEAGFIYDAASSNTEATEIEVFLRLE